MNVSLDGVLVVDKPAGMTSHDVVDAVRRALRTRKVGHGGTLDPDATGVLVLGVGRATRFLAYSQDAPKRYTAVASFGVTTSTQDASGEILRTRPPAIDRNDVERAVADFVGDLEQVPPMVSAVKVAGERLYKRARRGEEVDRSARRVIVYELSVVDFASGPDTPTATLDVCCSGGTYVRTLVHDIGEGLGCGAHLASLRRTESGGFTLADAIPLSDVSPRKLRSMVDAVMHLPRVEADAAAARLVANGRPLETSAAVADGRPVAVTSGEELLAVYRRDGGRLVAERVVPR